MRPWYSCPQGWVGLSQKMRTPMLKRTKLIKNMHGSIHPEKRPHSAEDLHQKSSSPEVCWPLKMLIAASWLSWFSPGWPALGRCLIMSTSWWWLALASHAYLFQYPFLWNFFPSETEQLCNKDYAIKPWSIWISPPNSAIPASNRKMHTDAETLAQYLFLKGSPGFVLLHPCSLLSREQRNFCGSKHTPHS